MSKKFNFYTDEHVPTSVVKGLRLRGESVLTTKEAGMLGKTDKEHIAFAKKEFKIIITQDDDFLLLHAKNIEHSGIIYAHQSIPIGKIIQGILLISRVLEIDDMKNHVEYL